MKPAGPRVLLPARPNFKSFLMDPTQPLLLLHREDQLVGVDHSGPR